MILQSDVMLAAVQSLRKALAENGSGQGQDRLNQVGQSLNEVEQALRQHAADLSDGEEVPAAADQSLLPSPGVERRTEGLRDQMSDLLREVKELRTEVSSGRATLTAGNAEGLANRLESLLKGLERHERNEIDLMQDSITPDIGAGD
jgi:hypothetical protein